MSLKLKRASESKHSESTKKLISHSCVSMNDPTYGDFFSVIMEDDEGAFWE